MAFNFHCKNHELVAQISGLLTFHQHQESEQFIEEIKQLVTKNNVNLVRINCAQIEHMDSHWLGVLVRILRYVRDRNAQLVVEQPNADVARLFNTVELSRIVEIRN